MITAAALESRFELRPGVAVRVQLPATNPICHPGQFFMLRCDAGWAPYLRRPLFPAAIDGRSITFWGIPEHDAGLAWLASQPEGSPLDMLGPLGRGFSVHPQDRRLLLVAEAAYAPPLLALIGPQLARQGSVGLLVEAPTAADLLPPALLPPAVEYHTATTDRSAGHHDTLDAVLDWALPWTDKLGAAGSEPFLRRLKRKVGALRSAGPADTLRAGFAQALAPVSLPCGLGACLACLVDTGRGIHRACQRGPVFDLTELG